MEKEANHIFILKLFILFVQNLLLFKEKIQTFNINLEKIIRSS